MFLVIRTRSGPDYDLERPLEQQSGWEEHAAFMDGLVDEGFVVLGGPLADEYRVALGRLHRLHRGVCVSATEPCAARRGGWPPCSPQAPARR